MPAMLKKANASVKLNFQKKNLSCSLFFFAVKRERFQSNMRVHYHHFCLECRKRIDPLRKEVMLQNERGVITRLCLLCSSLNDSLNQLYSIRFVKKVNLVME